jgi:hypothetical protein
MRPCSAIDEDFDISVKDLPERDVDCFNAATVAAFPETGAARCS